MLQLVTGAAGKTGRAVVRALSARGVAVRALVRRPEQVPALEELGTSEVMVGDLLNPEDLAEAARGVRVVYHLCPNLHPGEIRIGRLVIEAARMADCERFVFHSVLHPQTEAMPHHWKKLRVEELLFESGLEFTILQPAAYMQNLLGGWADITERGLHAVPYAGETRLSLVDLEDVAEVAARVSTEPGHLRAVYELCGPEALTQHDVAETLTQQLARPVRVEALPIPTWRARARSSGLGVYQVECLTAMFEYYEAHGFCGNPGVLAWLLGRPATPLSEFIARHSPPPSGGEVAPTR